MSYELSTNIYCCSSQSTSRFYEKSENFSISCQGNVLVTKNKTDNIFDEMINLPAMYIEKIKLKKLGRICLEEIFKYFQIMYSIVQNKKWLLIAFSFLTLYWFTSSMIKRRMNKY
ncbi:hypothetical protein MXB_3686, partial [Myxobolus squamalis]